MILNKVIKAFRKPKIVLIYIIVKLGFLFPDKLYLEIVYRLQMGKKLNLRNPQTYNEKLQWMKLYDRNPMYTIVVDKLKSKDWVAERIGEEHIIPFIGVFDKWEEIDFDKLPNQFVIKCTHNCGVVVCKDKVTFDVVQARKKIMKSMKSSYYMKWREWPYKDVSRKILIEKYMVDESGTELKDYKFFCFGGEPKLFFIGSDRNTDVKFDFFDTEFNHLPIRNGHDNTDKKLLKPDKFEEMIEISRKLSQGFPQVRVDLYNVNGNIYFGEMTLFHFAGIVPFEPEEWDYKLGSWINL